MVRITSFIAQDPFRVLLAAAILAAAGCANLSSSGAATTPEIESGSSAGGVHEGDDAADQRDYSTRLDALRSENAMQPLEVDRFRGWANAPESLISQNPDGYFRVAKVDGTWWFITPDGSPFVSKGVTDVNWLGATLSPGPFHDILARKYLSEDTWAAAQDQRVSDWGFNTIGPWSSRSMADRLPHSIVILDSAQHAPRPPGAIVTDFWSPTFREHAENVAQQRAAPHTNDKNLIGYFLDNELTWGPDHWLTDKTLLQLYLEYPGEAPGRQEALQFVRRSADSIDAFNQTWGTNLSQWDEMAGLSSEHFHPRSEESRTVSTAFCVYAFNRYATVAIGALRAVDPNHLILGCRFHTYPGDALIKAAAEHFDVISMAFYEARPPVKELDAICEQVDKPFLIEEWTFKSGDSGIVNPDGIYAPVVPTRYARSLSYGAYVETFMRRPYAVGYHWYKWMDNPVIPEEPLSGDNCGLVNQDDEPYDHFVDFVREVNLSVERWHAEGGDWVQTIVSTEDGSRKLSVEQPIALDDERPEPTPVIEVDLNNRGQTILGLGASLEHATCENLSKLSDDMRRDVIESLVDPQTGIGMNLLRICIGASDFIGEPYYTYNDLPAGETDPELARFSIEKDRAYVLPAIKIALEKNPRLLLFASPWSPPAWMKTTGTLGTGSLKREWYPAYAKYLLKFIQAYEAEGIPIHAITIQNEPYMVHAAYPTTLWTAEEQRDFIRDHLGPLFEAQGVDTQIWCWDHNWNRPDFPRAVLSDPEAAQYVDGTAFHLYEGRVENQSLIKREFPDKHVYFSEGSVFGTRGALQLAEILRHWSRSYNAWVIMLDERQKPNRGPHNATPTSVELLDDGSVRYNFDYYMYGQFMKFIQRGAVRIESTQLNAPDFGTVSFLDPNGQVVLVAANSGRAARSFTVTCGERMFTTTLPPRAVGTYLWDSAVCQK
ncbi:MAG: hypothetical protein KJ060_10625 [Candidatus Hydrogenedentes bacterium]|nr:hypothetical protein [Candidatus Hydrogenedentota bacterium]